jgi:divalent metal cation (Fe/Co/Zn/Cd) transporter
MTQAYSEGMRARLVRKALALEWLTIAWMVVEAAVALSAGIAAHSLSVTAFGADSVIELMSAGVLLWRLDVELRLGRVFAATAEARARKIAGALLFALALYVVAGAIWSLWTGTGQDFTPYGLAVSVVAIPVMALLARRKLAIAQKIESAALRADAIEAVACMALSLVVVAGLLAQRAFGAWWIDGAASLAIVVLLVKEGREAWGGTDD